MLCDSFSSGMRHEDQGLGNLVGSLIEWDNDAPVGVIINVRALDRIVAVANLEDEINFKWGELLRPKL